ncbi:hypothetical protein Thiowin_01795 [Thiorhodovibrio winogradskyi]|uniref:SpoVT-AbrB domain-containing protein n=1 Tax=Thiorhodovibrio winogradskyi TaxID=77007 RepID=A0ABZ0S767_9GAMM|nr:hypothetical protein [Thiorhodovibrio winogradskyi]
MAIQTIEAAIDENGRVFFPRPVRIKGVHRALVTILDEPPRPIRKEEETESAATSDALFGIWKDHPDISEIDDYVRQLRNGRF